MDEDKELIETSVKIDECFTLLREVELRHDVLDKEVQKTKRYISNQTSDAKEEEVTLSE